MYNEVLSEIRPQCLRPAYDNWEQPTGPELREVIRRTAMTHSQISSFLGLSNAGGGGRQIRRWIAGEAKIPYSAWALLCHVAGLGEIWGKSLATNEA